MSRHTFEGRKAGVQIIVGWDNPLETYFAQVWEGGPATGELLLWAGTVHAEVKTVESLARLVAPHGDIPEEVVTRLEDDYDQRSEPTPLQRLLRK